MSRPVMDPRKLIYFASVIEHGSLKAAARALGLSQPALSMSMDRLEAELNQRLLDRSPRGVVPTAMGDVLYSHARLICGELMQAERDISDHESDESKEIRLGSLPSLAGSVVPTALGKWREAFPDETLHVLEGAQFDLLTGLLQRQFDIVIGYTECYDIEDGLRQRVLFRDRLCVIARPKHPLAAYEGLGWAEIVRYPWISPTSRRPHAVLEAALKIAKIPTPVQSTYCGSAAMQKSLIANSNHLAMLPTHAIRAELLAGSLIRLPIQDQALDRNIAVFFREDFFLSDAARSLIDHVAKVGQAMCAGSEL